MDYRKAVNTALSEVGYQGESKNSKFTEFLDSISWYNFPKKNSCTWCAIFVDYCVAINAGNLSYEQARQIVCEPADHNANTGAGCTQHAQMYKDHGRWISKVSDATTGDQVFFKKSNGQIYHTGIMVDWDSKGIYTVEGSTDGGKVSKRFYSYGDSKLAGFGRPDWYKFDEEKTEEPVADPTPPAEPPVEPRKSVDELAREVIAGKWGNGKERADRLSQAGYDYQAVQDRVNEILKGGSSGNSSKTKTVCVNTRLNVRSGAGTNYPIVRQLKNGDKVTVYETSGDWSRIGNGEWVCSTYLK